MKNGAHDSHCSSSNPQIVLSYNCQCLRLYVKIQIAVAFRKLPTSYSLRRSVHSSLVSLRMLCSVGEKLDSCLTGAALHGIASASEL